MMAEFPPLKDFIQDSWKKGVKLTVYKGSHKKKEVPWLVPVTERGVLFYQELHLHTGST